MLIQRDTYKGRTQRRPNGSVRTRSSRPREEPQEGCGFGTPAATNLDSEHNEVAVRRARKLGAEIQATPNILKHFEHECA